MSEASYEIRFSGKIVEGQDPAAVKTRMAELFKVPIERIERLFSGRTAIIKRGLDPEAAIRYRAALHRIGAVVEMRPEQAENPPSPVQTVTPPAPEAARASTQWSIAEPGALLAPAKPVQRVDIDTSGLSMASPGVDLVEPAPRAEPDIDVEDLSIAPAGVDLVESAPRTEARIDTSGMSLAPPGERLSEPHRPPRAEIDTSDLKTL